MSMNDKKVLLLGSEGSIGKRYYSILKHLGVNLTCYDTCHRVLNPMYRQPYDYVLIATPTIGHITVIKDVMLYSPKARILCEKPISKNTTEIKEALNICPDLQMVFQYCMYWRNNTIGKGYDDLVKPYKTLNFTYSTYDFYNSGKDSLPWDAIQILALHKGPIEQVYLKNDSPIWNCVINGMRMSYQQMQYCYLDFMRDWLMGERFLKPETIIDIHNKVYVYLSEYVYEHQSNNRNPGKINIVEASRENF